MVRRVGSREGVVVVVVVISVFKIRETITYLYIDGKDSREKEHGIQ